jgi:hypothetical protein
VDVWIQQPEWYQLYHVELPRHEIKLYHPFEYSDYYVVSADGDILVDTTGSILHFDSNRVMLVNYSPDKWFLIVLPHMLKGS